MILSEQRPLTENLIPKLDSDDEEITFPRSKTRRQASPTRIVDAVLENENDDDDERLARRKSRLLEPHPASANSPCASGSTARRRDAAAPRGISQAQIGEHYGNCIRLAAENKITAKNAFNLHLIDYMSDMLKKEDYASFQIASSSLDAGAKIYAGRVDAVHQETYQVLTGLGRSDKPQATVDDDDDVERINNGDDLDSQTGGAGSGRHDARKKTQIHRDILQKQLNKIRSKVLAAKADVDPLFQHQTATYDEGGTAELRLNQLSTLDEACLLILDSSTRLMQTPSQPTSNTVNVAGIMEFLFPLQPKNAGQLLLCPSLQNFRFTGWDKSQDWDSSTARPSELQITSPTNAANDSKMFTDNNDDDVVDDYPQHGTDDDNNDLTLTEQVPQATDQLIPCGSSNEAAAPHFTETQAVLSAETGRDDAPSPPIHTTGTDGELFVSSLKSMLDKQYEHFGQLNDHLLGMWAGPEHWRKKAKRRRFDPVTGQEEEMDLDGNEENADAETEGATTTVGKSRKSSRSKKGKAVRVTYLEALTEGENKTRNGHLTRRDWPKSTLSEGVPNTAAANATVFKEQYRQKASRQMNLLPSELSDSRQTLYRLFNREVILESSQPGGQTTDGPPKLGAPQVDRLGTGPDATSELCPVIDWADGPGELGRDRDGHIMHDHVMDDMDEAPDLQICINDDDDDDDIALPFECAFTQPTTVGLAEYGMLGDLELVSQPRKVARVEIGYARTAKMINVRRLKSAMWAFLEDSIPNAATAALAASATPRSPYSAASTSSAPEPPASLTGDPDLVADLPAPPTSDQTDEPTPRGKATEPRVPGARTFSELIDSFPNRISWQMAKELSISIALNCLLHLSNEKELYLECSEGLSDIFISQGLPQFELEQLNSYASDAAYDEGDADGPAKRATRPDGGRQAKTKRFRPSTLDSWLADNDRESQSGTG